MNAGADAPVTVVIPTHRHPETLRAAADSVLAQSFTDLRLVIIGDGVDDGTRTVAAALESTDDRVEFLDLPKGERHGETHRRELLERCGSRIVAYCGDDDLLWPDHIETMVDLLEGRDFVHPLPVIVRQGCNLEHLPCDLSQPKWVRWVVASGNNAISLTGVAHTMDSYRRLPCGWRTTPAGIPTDLYMWQQYLALPGVRAVTSPAATTVKLQDDEDQDPVRRVGWSRVWWERIRSGAYREQWDADVAAAVRRAARDHAMLAHELRRHCDGLEQERHVLMADVEWLQAEVARQHRQLEGLEGVCRSSAEHVAALQAERADLLGSPSWKLTAPLRGAARAARRRVRRA